jgi:hypothetical protein
VRLIGTGRLADLIARLLPATGPVVVVGDLKLARALSNREIDVVVVGGDESTAARHELRRIEPGELAGEAASAAVIAGVAQTDDGAGRVREIAAAVSPGGVVVLIDKGSRTRSSTCALLGGLSRLRQDVVARTVVTSGVV